MDQKLSDGSLLNKMVTLLTVLEFSLTILTLVVYLFLIIK